MRQDITGPLVGAGIGMAVAGWAYLGVALLTLEQLQSYHDPGLWLFLCFGLLFGAVVANLRHSQSADERRLARWCTSLSVAFGCAGFVLGTIGPFLFWPDSPRAPLLGFCVTGPLGVVLGALAGLGIGSTRAWE